jgi:hypothetical protein
MFETFTAHEFTEVFLGDQSCKYRFPVRRSEDFVSIVRSMVEAGVGGKASLLNTGLELKWLTALDDVIRNSLHLHKLYRLFPAKFLQ